MQSLQEIFNRTQELKKKQKDLRATWKDALASSSEYQELIEKATALRERKKQIELTIKEQYASELIKIDDIQIDLASDAEMMADIALSMLAKGEPIAVTDEYNNAYEPLFKISFKKTS